MVDGCWFPLLRGNPARYRCASGPAVLAARPGCGASGEKTGKTPQGKASFPLRGFLYTFLGQKPAHFSLLQRDTRNQLGCFLQTVSRIVDPGWLPPWRGSGSAEPPASSARYSLMPRKPLPMISEEEVMVIKEWGSVARTNSCSRMAWERLITVMMMVCF